MTLDIIIPLYYNAFTTQYAGKETTFLFVAKLIRKYTHIAFAYWLYMDIASTHPLSRTLDELLQDVAYLMFLFCKVKCNCMFIYVHEKLYAYLILVPMEFDKKQQ